MILKVILCVQHFCSFGAMLFNVIYPLMKTDSTVICVPYMLEHVCYEPFSLKICGKKEKVFLKRLCQLFNLFVREKGNISYL